jgi:hypothetical protein
MPLTVDKDDKPQCVVCNSLGSPVGCGARGAAFDAKGQFLSSSASMAVLILRQHTVPFMLGPD